MEDKIQRRISEIDKPQLMEICNDILNWRTGNGDLDKESTFYKTFDKMKDAFNNDIRFFEHLILSKAHDQFGNIVKLLFMDKPILYIKK